jgi:uncharacterized protein RhaS with RHS repeats
LSHLGIFGQTDPIGYAGGANLYAYVLADPINLIDPLGLTPKGCEGATVCGCPSPSQIRFGDYCVTIEQLTIKMPFRRSYARNQFGGRRKGGQTKRSEAPDQTCRNDQGTTLGAARSVLSTTSDIADVVSIGTAATGMGGPISITSKIVSRGSQVLLLGLNTYDAIANKNYAPLESQVAALIADPLGVKSTNKLRTVERNVGGKYGNLIDIGGGKASEKTAEKTVCTIAGD